MSKGTSGGKERPNPKHPSFIPFFDETDPEYATALKRIRDKNEKLRIKFEWINNRSFVQLTASDGYRVIIGWDFNEQEITGWGFGALGGHGKYDWGQMDSDEDLEWVGSDSDWCNGSGAEGRRDRDILFSDGKLVICWTIPSAMGALQFVQTYKRVAAM